MLLKIVSVASTKLIHKVPFADFLGLNKLHQVRDNLTGQRINAHHNISFKALLIHRVAQDRFSHGSLQVIHWNAWVETNHLLILFKALQNELHTKIVNLVHHFLSAFIVTQALQDNFTDTFDNLFLETHKQMLDEYLRVNR